MEPSGENREPLLAAKNLTVIPHYPTKMKYFQNIFKISLKKDKLLCNRRKNLLRTLAQNMVEDWSFTRIFICGALHDLVPFVQFNKRENTHGRVLILVNLQASACTFTKINTPLWVFFMFFKLYKWYQIMQRTTYCLQSEKLINQTNFTIPVIESLLYSTPRTLAKVCGKLTSRTFVLRDICVKAMTAN